MSSTFQYDWLTSSFSWDSQRECSSKSLRYSWFDSNRDCRISCVVIGIHSLQGCRSVHIAVTIITIGVWKPRGKKTTHWLNSFVPLYPNLREAVQMLCAMLVASDQEVTHENLHCALHHLSGWLAGYWPRL